MHYQFDELQPPALFPKSIVILITPNGFVTLEKSVKMRLKLLLFLITATFHLANAQNEIYFSHLGMETGLSNSRANAIIQDHKGFIWVGTWNGLNRYDGYTCTTFQPSFHDSTSISNREIVALMEDSKGNIWIGTSNGLNCLNPESGKLKNYPFHSRILSLFEDPNHTIWVGTWSDGLYNLNPENGEMNHFLQGNIVSDILIDSRNILWIATYYGLREFDRNTQTFKRYLPDSSPNSISNSTVTQLAEASNGDLWVGTWGGGLNKVQVSEDGQQVEFSRFQNRPGSGSLDADIISVLYYDQFNNLWIGTWNEGLRLLKEDQQQLSPDKAQFLSYTEQPDNPASLSEGGVSAIWVDRTGMLWVGASTLDRSSIIENGVNRYSLPKDQNNPFHKVYIKAFAKYKNQLWIGANYSLFQYELTNGKYLLRKRYTRPQYRMGTNTFSANSILDLAADSSGLWVGTEDAGLIHYSYTKDLMLDQDDIQYFNQQTTPAIPGNKVNAITISLKYPGVIWVGTLQNGMAKLYFQKDRKPESTMYDAGNSNESCTDYNIREIHEDRSGKVWIGTQNGLNCFNPKTNLFQHFFYSASNPNSINDNVINTIKEDAYGSIWVGTNSGLNRRISVSDNKGNSKIQFKGYPDIDFLSNEIVTNILEDKSGNLWVRLYRGFVKFDIKNENVAAQYFTKDYENTRVERNTTLTFSDGQFVLGEQSGFLTLLSRQYV